MSEPSQSEANHALRVLKGEPLRFTCRVHFPEPDCRVIEFQTDAVPDLVWDEQARALWLQKRSPSHELVPIMAYLPGMVILTEQNPGWKKEGS